MKVNDKIMNWLLEDNNPSVRYYTMKYLLGVDVDSTDLIQAKKQIMVSQTVTDILSNQSEDGFWGVPDKFYTMKYKGTVWQLMILAELGADPEDDRIHRACEFILNMSQNVESGGFSTEHGKKTNAGLSSKVIPCLTGNITWALIKLGYLNDDRVQASIDWIVKNQRADDGNKPKLPDWAYENHVACFSSHTCFMGVVKSLKALSAIPKEMRSDAVTAKIDELVEFILIHHIHKRSHDLNKDSKSGWKRLGFPLMYQTDILEILTILVDLDVKDERMNEAMMVLRSKQLSEGSWKLENTYNGKFIVDIETKGEPSKWLTFKALYVLNKE
ncbi:MAG: terpene cyclase/mutase family protein [Clostridiales bacterium]|nr:terpene cyclase/mutase family protein [Clostridiales bacterium]